LTTGLISGIIADTRELDVGHYLHSRCIGREDVARLSVPFADSDRIITVVYHRIAVRCGNSATGVEIVKKERFRRGFYCDTIF